MNKRRNPNGVLQLGHSTRQEGIYLIQNHFDEVDGLTKIQNVLSGKDSIVTAKTIVLSLISMVRDDRRIHPS